MPDHSAPLPQFSFELSDADGTLELPAADRTLQNLAPIPSTSLATPRRRPVKADGTEELCAEDILEVSRVVTAPRAEGTQEISPDDILEVERVDVDVTEPISIAPIALDVEPRHVPEPTLRVLRQQPLPGRRELGIYAVGGSLGVSAMIGLGVLLSYAIQPSSEPTGAPLAFIAAAKESQVETKLEDVQAKDTRSVAAEPPAEAAPDSIAMRPRAPSAPVRMGTVRVAPSVRGILVDGTPRAVSGGSVAVKCGRHKIKVAPSAARIIDVPCGGTATL